MRSETKRDLWRTAGMFLLCCVVTGLFFVFMAFVSRVAHADDANPCGNHGNN